LAWLYHLRIDGLGSGTLKRRTQHAIKYRYGYRWRAEGNLSAVKRLAGEHTTATKKANMYKEVAEVPAPQLDHKVRRDR
jgi:hypothetical protein